MCESEPESEAEQKVVPNLYYVINTIGNISHK